MGVIQDQAEKGNGITGGVSVEYIHMYIGSLQKYWGVVVKFFQCAAVYHIHTRTLSLKNASDKKQISGPY